VGGNLNGGNPFGTEQGTASSSGPLDPRQVGAALGNTATDLQALRNLVNQLNQGGNGRRPGALGTALENVNEALNAAQIGQGRFQGDPAQLEKIAQQILNPLREAELELSRHYESLVEKDKIRAALEDDTPAAYQNEVKAYFETVGKGK
jgi:hypothetical protein